MLSLDKSDFYNVLKICKFLRTNKMNNYQWSAELQDSDRGCSLRHRRFIISAVISGFTSALFAITFVTVWWYEYPSVGGVNYTMADWERVFVESGPLECGWEKEAE